jgi:hypothetical protein
MLDRTAQFGDELSGTWSRNQLLEMNSRFCEALNQAFQAGRESPVSARATVVVRGRKQRATEETILAAAWEWFVRRNEGVEDIAFVDVVARCPGVDPMRIRASFDRRFGRRSTTSSA